MQQHKYNAETEYNILLQPDIIKSKFALQDEELVALAEFGKLYKHELNNFIDDFYKWMRELPEFSHFFPNATLVDRVKQQQIDYLSSLRDSYLLKDILELANIRNSKKIPPGVWVSRKKIVFFKAR